jgi:nucleoside 2-deoxyribosyltransferase
MPNTRSVFLVGPIGEEDSPERKQADQLLKWIVGPVCNDLQLTVQRADHISTPGRINAQIARCLVHCDLVVADLTGLNSNVMYEVGVRHGLRLPIVQLAASGTRLPFDLVDVRTVFYDFSIERLELAKEAFKKAVNDALKGDGDPLIGTVLSSDTTYRGVNVAGSWTVVFPKDEHRREITIELQQCGERLSGVSTHIKKSEEIRGDRVRTYKIEGRVYNRFVLINGMSANPQRLAINSFLLEITGDGQVMRGAVMAYSTVNTGIFSLPCECLRSI